METPYILSNFVPAGDIVSELSFPSINLENQQTLINDDIKEMVVNNILQSTDPLLANTLTQMVNKVDTSYVKLKPECANIPTQPMPAFPLLKKMHESGFSRVPLAPIQNKLFTPEDYVAIPRSLVDPRYNKVVSKVQNNSPSPQKTLHPQPTQVETMPKNNPQELPEMNDFRNMEVFVDIQEFEPDIESKVIESTKVIELDLNENPVAPTEPTVKQYKRRKPLKQDNQEINYETIPFNKFYAILESIIQNDKQNPVTGDLEVDLVGIAKSQIPQNLLSHIAIEISRLKTNSYLHKLPHAILCNFLDLMWSQIKLGIEIEELESAETNSPDFLLVTAALEACSIVLKVVTENNLPKTLLKEEILSDIISLIKNQLTKNIFAFYEPSFGEKEVEEEPSEEGEDQQAVTKKKTKEKTKKKISGLNILIGKVCEVLDLLLELMEKQLLADTLLLPVTSLCIPAFFIDGIPYSLQLNSMNIARTLFSRYPQFRGLILEDILVSITKLPKNKRNLRTFVLTEEKKSIQMISSLVMQLIQSCVALPASVQPVETTSLDLAEVDPTATKVNMDTFEGAVNCAASFIALFVKRCAEKNTENDYRPVLENFVQDLLTTFNLPEWPASELLLQVLSMQLANHLKDQNANSALRLVALDLMGNILAKIKQEINQSQHDTIYSAPKNVEVDGKPIDAEEDANCVCFQGYQGQFMLDCDRCHKWYHGSCVGIDSANPPEIWYCEPCEIQRRVETQLTSSKKKNSDLQATQSIVTKQILLNYLAQRIKSDPFVLFSRRYHIAKWFDEGDNEDFETRSHFASQWNIPKSDNTLAESCMSRNTAIAITRYFASKRILMCSFDNLLKNVLKFLHENQAALRSKAIKSLTVIIASDPAILGDVGVQTAVQDRMFDSSISVREATVDLVGKYILYKPEFAAKYYPKIVDRIMDTGLSVRKRVIKILRDLCLQDPRQPLTAEICCKLVSRIGDEESIRDLILKTFQELWFSEKIGELKSNTVEFGIHERAQLLLSVVSSVHQHEWLIDLLEKLLSKDVDKSKKPIYTICQKICTDLSKFLIELDEKRSSSTKQEEKDQISEKLAACGTSLNIFCTVSPDLLIPHATILSPYLKTQATLKKGDMVMVSNISQILEKVVPLMEHPDSAFLSQLEADLVSLIENQGMMVIQSSIKCLCAVVEKATRNTSIVANLLAKFYQTLTQQKKAAPNSKDTIRSLFVIALLCRNFDFQKNVEPETAPFVLKKMLETGHFLEQIATTFLNYSKSSDEQIQAQVLNGLGHLIAKSPSLLSKAEALMNASLAKNANPRMKTQALKNCCEVLHEEEKVQKRQRTNLSEDSSKGAEFTQLSVGLIHTHIGKILDLTLDLDATVRTTALDTVSLILRHGLANPIQCMPYLIAAIFDTKSRKNSEKAQSVLFKVHEKNTDFLSSRILSGVKLGFKFQREIAQSCNVFATTLPKEPLLCGVYSFLKLRLRQHFLEALLTIFEETKEEFDILRFVAEVIISFPFSSEEEPLFVIYQINRILTLKSSSLHAKLKPYFKKNANEAKKPDGELTELCKMIPKISILFLLKKFLKDHYSLPNSKCLSYSPNDKAEKVVQKSFESVNFDERTSPFASTAAWLYDKANLQTWRKQYEMLKEWMKEDGDDFKLAAARVTRGRKRKTEDKKEKKPKKTPKKKKAKAEDEEDSEDEENFIP